MEQVGDAVAEVGGYGADFGSGEHEGGVHIDDAVAGVLNFFEGEVEEDGGIGVFPARVAGRKETADVAGGDGAEQGVGDGVQEHVAVGVSGESFGVGDGEAADFEGHSGLECVRVPAVANAYAHVSFSFVGKNLFVRCGTALQIKLGQFQVAGLGDFEIGGRALDDGDLGSGALDEAGLVGAEKAVGLGFGEGALEQGAAKALRSLRADDVLARNGGGDDGSVGGALDLLDGIDGGEGDDGGAVFFDGANGSLDGGCVDEGAYGVVDEDDVVVVAVDGVEGVGDALLAVVASFDHADLAGKSIFADLRSEALDFGGAHGDDHFGDLGHGGKGAQGVDKDGNAAKLEKLLGGGSGDVAGGHSSAQSRRRKNDKDPHKHRSISARIGGALVVPAPWRAAQPLESQHDP